MGFSEFERERFKALCRSNEKIDTIIDEEYPTEVVQFLTDEVF